MSPEDNYRQAVLGQNVSQGRKPDHNRLAVRPLSRARELVALGIRGSLRCD